MSKQLWLWRIPVLRQVLNAWFGWRQRRRGLYLDTTRPTT